MSISNKTRKIAKQEMRRRRRLLEQDDYEYKKCSMQYRFHEGSLVQVRRSFTTWTPMGYNLVNKGTIAMVVKGPYPCHHGDGVDILVEGTLFREAKAKCLVTYECD